MRDIKIAPSMLACDFSRLREELALCEAAGADLIHLDVMDGRFVPNISFGAPVIAAMRPHSSLPFDVHLMIAEPLRYIADFAGSGADFITFHVESESDPAATIDAIHAAGCRASMSIKPATPAATLYPYLSDLEMVLVMSVEPGFGGQSFLPDTMDKAAALYEHCIAHRLDTDIQVDGGIGADTAPAAAAAGCNVLVAGSAIFGADDPAQAVRNIRRSAQENRRR